MLVNLKVQLPAPLGLPAIRVLTHLKGAQFFHAERNLRHPLSAYKVSFQDVEQTLALLVTELETFYALEPDVAYDDKELCKRIRVLTETLLKALHEHIDTCKGIVKSMLAPQEKGESKAETKLLRDFRSSIKLFESRIGNQANAMKHRTARVRMLHVCKGPVSVPGYFIEANVDNGTVGPDPSIHHTGRTAFSYNRELRLYVVGLYHLSDALFYLVRAQHGLIEQPTMPDIESSEWRQLVRRVATLPLHLFPDEYDMPFPQVELSDEHCTLTYLESTRIPKPSILRARIRLQHEYDAITPGFTLPYLYLSQ